MVTLVPYQNPVQCCFWELVCLALVAMGVHVSEPETLLLFGVGLIGMVGQEETELRARMSLAMGRVGWLGPFVKITAIKVKFFSASKNFRFPYYIYYRKNNVPELEILTA